MNRAQKAESIRELAGVFGSSGSVVVCHYAGLSVAEMSDFRRRMRAAGGSVKVAKNRLAKIALKGQPCEALSERLTGPTALVYAEDPVAPAKVAEDFARENAKLIVVGGVMGAEMLDAAGVLALSKMPSREEVLSQIVGCLMAPGANLAGAVTAPATALAGIVKTLSERESAD